MQFPASRFTEARDAAADQIADAKAANVGDARESASRAGLRRAATPRREKVADAKAVAAEQIAKVKPRLRGVSHEYAFFVSLVARRRPDRDRPGTARRRLAVAIYAAGLSALFGVSALYHRVDWQRPAARRWMRRLDHTMIFFLIAGTVTPFALLVMDGALATALLIAVWAGARSRDVVELVWARPPKWVAAARLHRLGWVGAIALPGHRRRGRHRRRRPDRRRRGALHGRRDRLRAGRPDPCPAVFGYHEIFHVLVIAAAAAHFAAIALYAVPA